MKRIAALILAVMCLAALSGCGGKGNTNGPFELTVTCGESSVEATRFTTEWSSNNSSVIACGFGPLARKDSMEPLIAEGDEPTAKLQFDVCPDSIKVVCWSEKYWGKSGAGSETVVPVSEHEWEYTVQLKDGEYIYEVRATWESSKKYHGTVCYGFYTE